MGAGAGEGGGGVCSMSQRLYQKPHCCSDSCSLLLSFNADNADQTTRRSFGT